MLQLNITQKIQNWFIELLRYERKENSETFHTLFDCFWSRILCLESIIILDLAYRKYRSLQKAMSKSTTPISINSTIKALKNNKFWNFIYPIQEFRF